MGKKWGRNEAREKRKNISRDTSGKRPSFYERDFKLLFLYSDDIAHYYDKTCTYYGPDLLQLLIIQECQANLRGQLLFLLSCLSIKLVYNGDITLPVT